MFTLKQRIRELELDLARAKVAQVEAECQNQNLKHQLISNIPSTHAKPLLTATNSNSWRQKFDAVVNSVNSNIPSMSIPTFQSHISDLTQPTNTDEAK